MTAARLISHSTTADCDNAIALFKKALQAEPNSSLAHSYLAMEATGRTHYDPDRSFLEMGRKEAEIALRLSPRTSYPHRALAGVLYQQGKFLAALEEGLQAIEIGGLQERAALFLGMTSDMLGRPYQALEWYRVASQLAASPGEVDAAIGDCWAKLGDDEQAEQAYNRAAELRPHSFEGTIGLAGLRVLQGDFEAAREICRTVHASHGETDDVAAHIEFFARKFDAAIELYAKLEKAHPEGGGSFLWSGDIPLGGGARHASSGKKRGSQNAFGKLFGKGTGSCRSRTGEPGGNLPSGGGRSFAGNVGNLLLSFTQGGHPWLGGLSLSKS